MKYMLYKSKSPDLLFLQRKGVLLSPVSSIIPSTIPQVLNIELWYHESLLHLTEPCSIDDHKIPDILDARSDIDSFTSYFVNSLGFIYRLAIEPICIDGYKVTC